MYMFGTKTQICSVQHQYDDQARQVLTVSETANLVLTPSPKQYGVSYPRKMYPSHLAITHTDTLYLVTAHRHTSHLVTVHSDTYHLVKVHKHTTLCNTLQHCVTTSPICKILSHHFTYL